MVPQTSPLVRGSHLGLILLAAGYLPAQRRESTILKVVRVAATALLLILFAGCGEPPAPPREPDETTQPWYGQTVKRLAEMTKMAQDDFEHGRPDDAASLIQQGEPLASQLLGVLHPTYDATVAAADLDALYARMLFSNRHYEWAQFLYQKNVARWKYWRPSTPETERRMKEAQAQVEECTRRMETRKGPVLPKK